MRKIKIIWSLKNIRAGFFEYFRETKIKSKALFEEIIYEKNKTYSILSLNTLIEKNLVTDERKII